MHALLLAGGCWAGIVKECILGALATQLIAEDSQIVSLYHRSVCAPQHGGGQLGK